MVRGSQSIGSNQPLLSSVPTDYYSNPITRQLPDGSGPEFGIFTPPLGCERPGQGARLSGSSAATIPTLLGDEDGRDINFNDPPYCLAFTVMLADDMPRFLMFISNIFGGGGDSLGSLAAWREEIIFTLRGVSARFVPSGGGGFTSSSAEVIHLQICVNADGNPTLYVNCVAVQTLSEVTFPRVDTGLDPFIFLNNESRNSNAAYAVSLS